MRNGVPLRFTGAAVLLAACGNALIPPNGGETAVSTAPGTGLVRINFTDGAARTIYPTVNASVFDHYVYIFTKAGESEGQIKTPDANNVFTLETGSWTLEV
jgi:hypothetical protein